MAAGVDLCERGVEKDSPSARCCTAPTSWGAISHGLEKDVEELITQPIQDAFFTPGSIRPLSPIRPLSNGSESDKTETALKMSKLTHIHHGGTSPPGMRYPQKSTRSNTLRPATPYK